MAGVMNEWASEESQLLELMVYRIVLKRLEHASHELNAIRGKEYSVLEKGKEQNTSKRLRKTIAGQGQKGKLVVARIMKLKHEIARSTLLRFRRRS